MIIIGFAFCIVGLLVLIFSWRGRIVARGQFCRKCRFDLTGLELSNDSICPECGGPTTPSIPHVLDELRSVHRGLLVFAVVVMMLGVSGQITQFQSINWYAKFPEGVLLWLEESGNDDALQELHDRLIPGRLSDEGLQSLIDRAFEIQVDETVAWDERWGDVLLYGFLEEELNPEDLATYLEGAIELDIKMDITIETFDSDAEYTVSAIFSDRTVWSAKFWKRWNSTPQYRSNPVGVTITDSVALANNPDQIYKLGDLSTQMLWDLKYISKYKLNAYIPIAHHQTDVQVSLNQEVSVEIFGQRAHSWSVQNNFVISRESNGRTSEQAILDSMAMERVNVYTQLDQARQHGLNYLGNIPIALQLSSAQQYSLHADAYFRVGDTELYYGEIDWEIKENLTKNLYRPNLNFDGEDPVGFYENNDEFWARAISLEKIDVVIRPRIGLDSKPSFTQRAFVFQGLAIETYSPEVEKASGVDRNGNPIWNWKPANRYPSYPLMNPVTAQFLDDE